LLTQKPHTTTKKTGALEALRLETWGDLATGGEGEEGEEDEEEQEPELVHARLAAAALPASLTSLSLHFKADDGDDYVWRLEGALDAARLSRLHTLTLEGVDGPSLDALVTLSATTALPALRALTLEAPFGASRDLLDALPKLAPQLMALTTPRPAGGLSNQDESAAWRALGRLRELPTLRCMRLAIPSLEVSPLGVRDTFRRASDALAAWSNLRALTRLHAEADYLGEGFFCDLLPALRVVDVWPPM
jgi:hypothetical protein